VAEGGGLLNRYTLQKRIEGSNPSVSASSESPGQPSARKLMGRKVSFNWSADRNPKGSLSRH
jgi:hypothetical protein